MGRENYDEKTNGALVDLLRNILNKDHEKRFSIEQIKNHTWMTGN